jgi:fused signal recognition particle receptor
MGLFDKFKNGLFKTAQQLAGNLQSLLQGIPQLSKQTLKELEEGLVRADMGAATAKAIVQEVEAAVKNDRSSDPGSIAQHLRKAVLEKLLKVHIVSELPKPVIILLVGVNGAGKTTTAGKLAARFSSEGRKVLLAAADTFRAAAEEQLTEWAQRAKVQLIRGAHGAAPSSVVFDALKSGVSQGADCMVVDTAGRLHNRLNLMDELKKIARVADKAAPGIHQEKWLVLDANTGQNALNQAREFHKEIGLTGLILTKIDGTAKGGIVVALAGELGLPVRYLGVGEQMDDLIAFDPQMFVEALIPNTVAYSS